MRSSIKRWGNSAAVRVPASVLAAARARLDQPVEVREERGCIVIEPLREDADDLATLVAGITDENIHGETDWGPPVGREIL